LLPSYFFSISDLKSFSSTSTRSLMYLLSMYSLVKKLGSFFLSSDLYFISRLLCS
jgi:hypothetical protein